MFLWVYGITGGVGLGLILWWQLRQKLQANNERFSLSGIDLPQKILIIFISSLALMGTVFFLLFVRSQANPINWIIFNTLGLILGWFFFFFYTVSLNGKFPPLKRIYMTHIFLGLLFLLPLLFLKSNENLPPGFHKGGKPPPPFFSSPDYGQKIPSDRKMFFQERMKHRTVNQLLRIQGNMMLQIHTGIPFLQMMRKPYHPLGPDNPFRHAMSFPQWKWSNTYGLVYLVLGWFYLVLIIRSIFLYAKGNHFTPFKKRNLLWLIVSISVVGVIHVMSTFSSLLLFFTFRSGRAFQIKAFLPYPLLMVSLFGLYMIIHRRPEEDKKYGKNTLSTKIIDSYFNRITTFMNQSKVFRDEFLTLSQVAESLKIHPNDLSQTINRKIKCNFRDFLNSYRVDDVKTALLNPKNKHKKILAIAMESGFNSKSSFNQTFKKHTRMTPSQFIKNATPNRLTSLQPVEKWH